MAATSPAIRPADRCPGVLRLTEAADGYLARVRLPGGLVTGERLRVLADLATELGDGRVELTSRGNVQLRALAAGAAAPLTTALAQAGLLPSLDHDRVRNILASPLAGLDDGGRDLTAIVGALDAALCARPRLAELSGRFLFAVDDGRGDVAGLGADVVAHVRADSAQVNELMINGLAVNQVTRRELTGAEPPGAELSGAEPPGAERSGAEPRGAERPGTEPRGAERSGAERSGAERSRTERSGTEPPGVERPGTERSGDGLTDGGPAVANGADADAVAAVMLAYAEAFLDERAATGSTAWRIADLPGGAGRVRALVAARLGLGPAPQRQVPGERVRATAARPVGIAARSTVAGCGQQATVNPDGLAAVVLLAPLGRLTAAQVTWLAARAAGRPARITPWRSVVLPDQPDAAGTLREAARLGFGVDDGSPWLRVTACAGRPGCASALADVQSDAAAFAARWPGRIVHVSGCERHCGRPAATEIDVTATSEGYQVAGV